MIDLSINKEQLERTVERARERGIIIPSFEEMKNPDLIPPEIKEELQKLSLWEIDSHNLFRISWQNEPVQQGGLFGGVNYLELPRELTGVKARIIGLVGKWMPTGAHKVGATFGCLVPRLITGQFDPTTQRAAWPSTGNYCRGGAYNSQLLACDSIAILPEGMSQERFDWLSEVAGEVIATPGTESDVKEIFDQCWELRESREDVVIFNQFDELGNHLWHYEVTGRAMEETLEEVMSSRDNYRGLVLASGSGGTLAAGDYLKELYPESKIAVCEALQCPTLLNNGFGSHRIEGIGDKHVPWIHNLRNTDLIIAVDDHHPLALLRLFNEPAGREYLLERAIPVETVERLSLMGISSLCNMVGAIKLACYYQLTEEDVLLTVFTDSAELYASRLREMEEELGRYQRERALMDYHQHLSSLSTDYLQELTLEDQRRIHNLKYYTWIEQQGKELDELNAQWHDYQEYWGNLHQMTGRIDRLIKEFNDRTGLLKQLKEG